jgi:uncharacterized iron-regulated membrane protein
MHLGAAALISLLVIFFSVTGALLAYERPIVRAADERSYRIDPSRQQIRLPLDALMALVTPALPAPVEMVTTHQDPHLPVELQTVNRSVYFVDPYSGKVTGPESPRLRGFFAQITALHRWFGLSNASHAAATAVKGAAALLLLCLLLSGAILWIPGFWTRSTLLAGIVPRLDGHLRARYFNWHKVTGFWIGLPLSIVVMTGVIMAYPWANAQLFHLAGSPQPPGRGNGAGLRRRAPGKYSLPAHLDQAFAQATSGVEDWQSTSLRLPPGKEGLSFLVDRGDGGHPEKREQVLIDPNTLEGLHREPFASLNRGQRWRAWVRFIHTGEAGGWWGETLAALTACGAVLLSFTGLVLFFNRLLRWRRRTTHHKTNAIEISA